MKKFFTSMAFVIAFAQFALGATFFEEELTLSPKYTIVVAVEARQEMREELLTELKSIQALSRKEEPCLEFNVYQDANNPLKFLVYEAWKNREGHALQLTRPYVRALLDRLPGLLAGPRDKFFMHEILFGDVK